MGSPLRRADPAHVRRRGGGAGGTPSTTPQPAAAVSDPPMRTVTVAPAIAAPAELVATSMDGHMGRIQAAFTCAGTPWRRPITPDQWCYDQIPLLRFLRVPQGGSINFVDLAPALTPVVEANLIPALIHGRGTRCGQSWEAE